MFKSRDKEIWVANKKFRLRARQQVSKALSEIKIKVSWTIFLCGKKKNWRFYWYSWAENSGGIIRKTTSRPDLSPEYQSSCPGDRHFQNIRQWRARGVFTNREASLRGWFTVAVITARCLTPGCVQISLVGGADLPCQASTCQLRPCIIFQILLEGSGKLNL